MLQATMTLDNGIGIPVGHAVVRKFLLNYNVPQSADIFVSVYKDEAAYNQGRPEVIQLKYNCTGDDFSNYFTETLLGEVGVTGLVNALEYLKSLAEYSAYAGEAPK